MVEWLIIPLHQVLMGCVAIDAERRHRNVAVWMVVTALFGRLAAAVWLIVRRRWPVVDNRTNSSDSRHWLWVPKKYIVGRIGLR
jgi:hypothetical protein